MEEAIKILEDEIKNIDRHARKLDGEGGLVESTAWSYYGQIEGLRLAIKILKKAARSD